MAVTSISLATRLIQLASDEVALAAELKALSDNTLENLFDVLASYTEGPGLQYTRKIGRRVIARENVTAQAAVVVRLARNEMSRRCGF